MWVEIKPEVLDSRQDWTMPFKVGVNVDFPRQVEYGGRMYSATGKVGTVTKTGLPSAEYQLRCDGMESRVWVDVSGNITKD